MAGIHNRIDTSLAGPGNKISANLLHASFILRALGAFNDTQILNAINAKLVTPLSGAELTDLSNIATAMDAEISVTDKIIYSERLRAVLIAIEEASLSDASMRSILGIA